MKGKNILVQFEHQEAIAAAVLGMYRTIESAYAGLNNPVMRNFDIDISGAMGEQAFAKAMGLYFHPTVNTFKDGDIGELIQIRTTKYKAGRLILRKEDNPEHFYALVIDDLPRFRVVGWMQGHDMKQKRYLDKAGKEKREAAYFVPQGDLHPFPLPIQVIQDLGKR